MGQPAAGGDSPTTPYFSYDTLEPGSVRLVLIKPPFADVSAAPVSCQLIQYPIDNAKMPSYEALSYTWGEETATETILIDGCPFLVRPNLHGAMRILRKPFEDRLMWIDAICIDQNDMGERDDQVPRMRTIYSRASTVMIYLGGDGDMDAVCALGLAHLRNIIDFCDKMDSAVDAWVVEGSEREQMTARARMIAKRYEFMFSREDPTEFIVAVSHALDHPWWKRVWTLQEVVLAQDAVLFCGDQTISWRVVDVFCRVHLSTSPVRDVLYRQGRYLRDFDVASAQRIIEQLILTLSSPITEIQALRNATTSTNPNITLSSAVTAIRGRKVTDARDMIYGILGLASNDFCPITPDYLNSTTRSTYVAAFRRIIKEDGDLRCLVWAHLEESSTRDRTLPSWVPDLKALVYANRRNIGTGPTSLNRGLCGVAGLNRIFNAPGKCDRHGDIQFHGSDGSTLVVQGVCFDRVITISERVSTAGDVKDDVNNYIEGVIQEWQSIAATWPGPYPGGAEIPTDTAFWATIAVGQKIIGYHPGFTRIGCRHPRDYRLEGTDDGRIPPRTPEAKATLVRALRKHNIGLRFFVTARHYFGVGAPEVGVGDEVCVLTHAEVPFLLRRTELGTYHLIGDWYVHFAHSPAPDA